MTDHNINGNHKNSNTNNNNHMTSDEKKSETNNHDKITNNKSHKVNSLKLQIPDANHKDLTASHTSGHHVKAKKHRDKSDLGDNFVAPDGGWGWVVAIASGFSMLCSVSPSQQFGIIFRERMTSLGINNSQLTTIINMQIAISAFTGLLNGPMFRRFTYRQVALMGAFLTFLGLFLAVFADSFIFYLWAYSFIYASGRGILTSASSLAVNTYFKKKRRTATAYQFVVAGMGPISMPHFATFLLQFFGVQGTVLMFSGMALHGFACALIYQPVKWHVKKSVGDAEALKPIVPHTDEHDHVIEPETPIMPRANDGWYGSRHSLTSSAHRQRLDTAEKNKEKVNESERDGNLQGVEMKRISSKDRIVNRNRADKEKEGSTQSVEMKRLHSRDNSFTRPRQWSMSRSIKEEENHEHEHENEHEKQLPIETSPQKIDKTKGLQRQWSINRSIKEMQDHEHSDEHEVQQPPMKKESLKSTVELHELPHEERKKLPFYKKIIIFFDLDLLRDVTYLNLAIGITLINFVEVNFAVLTPFILHDFGFQGHDIALAMSLLGLCDLVVRFLIPVITAKLNFSNQAFFAFGILGMCLGRIVLSVTHGYYTMLAVFVWMGLNKALRTVFWSLIIPGYVPLKRLPAAAGLQLLMSGFFAMSLGPVIGLIRDNTNYAFTLNFLNCINFLAILTWSLEALYRKHQRRGASSKPVDGDES